MFLYVESCVDKNGSIFDAIVILKANKDVVEENKWQKNQHLDWYPAVLIMTQKSSISSSISQEKCLMFL